MRYHYWFSFHKHFRPSYEREHWPYLWARSKTRKSRKPRKSRKKQLNQSLPAQNREINTQNPFDIAWEEKTKKIKIFRDFRVFVLSSIPKTKTQKSRKFYKKAIILKYENVASKVVEMLFKWHQTQNHSATLLIL